MKKLLVLLMSLLITCGCVGGLVGCSCDETYEIAVVTDVGALNDGGFNQGTWEGAEKYAKDNNLKAKYYQPANGANATDDDRIAAMTKAINNGAKVVVLPGFLQESALKKVAKANPDVKFIFIDGFPVNDDEGNLLKNVAAISYKEQESGYFAGYAAVMDGYRSLGFTGGGSGTNPAVNRYGYGFVLGAEKAATELNLADGSISMKYSYQYGANFSASSELQTQISGWYNGGTEIVFACGGSMVNSVKAAAEANSGAKIIGVDTDQSGLTPNIVMSAGKGLAASVELALKQFYNNEWDEKLGGQLQQFGAKEDATMLYFGGDRVKAETKTKYEALFTAVKNGTEPINLGDANLNDFSNGIPTTGLTKLTVDFV